MPAWNLILQKILASGSSISNASCAMFVVPGLSRPARIAFLAADPAASRWADDAHRSVEAQFSAVVNLQKSKCGGPGLLRCQAWHEPACEQILVPVLGAPLDPAVASFMTAWQAKGGKRSRVIPALLPGLSHGNIFGATPPSLSRLNAAAWGGDPKRLAQIAVQAALGHRPGVFLSYLRSEAREVADQLFDTLSQRGYRVFLDRFSGTPGHVFPQELAEEMADKAVLVLLETPGLAKSKWTQWEIAFARRYRLGVIALSLPGTQQLRRVAARQPVTPQTNGKLSPTDLDAALSFIGEEHAQASLRRRAFYEGLVGAAAASRSGHIRVSPYGILHLVGSAGSPGADILPCGRPGQLADTRTLSVGSTTQCRLLIGQHAHLAPAARSDLEWLAQEINITLVGPSEAFRTVQNHC
jgi:hypothetical protein